MRDGLIAAVELLEKPNNDGAAIDQATALFIAQASENFDGFEIWDQSRVVFRYPDEPSSKSAA